MDKNELRQRDELLSESPEAVSDICRTDGSADGIKGCTVVSGVTDVRALWFCLRVTSAKRFAEVSLHLTPSTPRVPP